MAAMSRGAIPKMRPSKNPKGGTPSSRRHHFESFSQRIAKLKIDAVRRGRNAILDDAELDTSFSYFRDALAEWRDLNLSETFRAFARQVAPLCDSLPQVLHHSDRILELLVIYIEKGDKHSEEPLLSLMAHFAHDLGARFENHFERAVRALSQLAAKHPDVEVIEWSFTCLAWLFKYLSRLLVPDLRPVFDLMAPLLGKEHQKAFVARFAAESLSFLVRKAGAVYHRDKNPLRVIVRHISEQLQELRAPAQDSSFRLGLMALFADSIKGVQRGLHSSAVPILQELSFQTYDHDNIQTSQAPLEPVLVGVLTAVIHHTDAEHFQPVLELLLAKIRETAAEACHLRLSSRLLFIVCGVRKGSRVADWQPVLEALSLLLKAADSSATPDVSVAQGYLSAVAVVFQYCPLDAAIPHVTIIERLSKGYWEKSFLHFCDIFAALGTERFTTLLLPYFKRFIIQKAQEHGDELCIVLPDLYRSGTVTSASLQPSESWQEDIERNFQDLAIPDRETENSTTPYKCNSILDFLGSVMISQERKHSIARSLYRTLARALKVSDGQTALPIDILAMGNGFRFLVQDNELRALVLDLWPSICLASAKYGNYLPFWQALLSIAEKEEANLDRNKSHMDSLKRALMLCLGSPSHDMRLVALSLLKILATSNDEVQSIIDTALLIEQTPVNLETQRSISMRIGQLARMYPTVCTDEWVGEAIPTFCFGLLHVRLASVWDDACSAMKAVCETKEGEDHVSRIAFEWLSPRIGESDASHTPTASTSSRYATQFECTNIMQLEELIANKHSPADDRQERLEARFDAEHSSIPFVNSVSRTQALRLLNELPNVAEKRSRLLVPVLLDWALDQKEDAAFENDDPSTQDPSRWTRKDQKAMLLVFSKFTNPKVLYRTGEVYSALLALLGNGDVEVQKAALNAILAWKEPSIIEYRENLLNLLDDARFRDEISVFLDVGAENSLIKETHQERLLPVMLRLLYGRVISGKRSLDAKRKAVFQALTRFGERATHEFLNIALGALKDVRVIKDGELDEHVLRMDLTAPRRQIGMLNMLEDMINTLKTTFVPFVGSVADPLLYCLVSASRILSKAATAPELESGREPDVRASMFKTIRQRSLQCLNILVESCPGFAWSPYSSAIVEEVVKPRIQQFPIETAQSVSGLLRLFSAWSKSQLTAPFLVAYNDDILSKIIECLGVPSAKDEVKQFVLDNILRTTISLVTYADDASVNERLLKNSVLSDIVQPYSNSILRQVGDLLRKSPSKDVLESGVQTVAELAPHVVGAEESRSMIEVSAFLLRQPSKRVSAPTKLGLLRIMHEFIPRCDSKDVTEIFDAIFDATCPLFGYLRDREARALLCDIVQDLSEYVGDLASIADLCHHLNAFSTSRLDEPDFDRRSSAFDTINGEASLSFSLTQWKPLLFNMLHFIKDNDELSIRVNASLSLRRFIQASTKEEEFKSMILASILPGIQNGMRESSELVRVEFLAVLAQLVESHSTWPPVADLHTLLSADEEASFYNNILHIQSHRRLRALRRLASLTAPLQGGNVYHILLPLLEHFVFDKADDESGNSLAGETIKTISVLSQWLEWPQFRSLLKRYIGFLTTKEEMQKTVIKLLAGLMDSLNEAGRAKGYAEPRADHTLPAESADDVEKMDVEKPVSTLTRTLPQQEKLTNDLVNNILPDLTEFLHKKDESTVSLRVPIAIAVAKILLVLPPAEVEARLPSVLLDICHILRSRAQDSRDMSRNTLAEIASFSGPAYLGFILKALRIALQRGYQLHVLSFTLHSILVRLSEQMKPGDLDYCITDIVDVLMDDIFGVTGQEKDAEDYISKMKEVKSSKSFDSLDIITRYVTPSRLVDLVLPIRSLLQEKLQARAVQKIDEFLRRMGLGVLQNPTLNGRDILVFCYELTQEAYRVSNSDEAQYTDPKNKKYLINIKGAPKSGARSSSTSYIYKLTRFGLDILRTVLRKHEELQTPQNLTGFLPVLGDAMVARQDEIQISAIRLLTTIIKVPMRELDENCPVYVTEAIGVIKGASSSNSEIAQTSLKFITAVLRERPNVEVKERHLALLLKRILPDLDEPDRQGVTFGFLKAVTNRKIVIAEVYEVMDRVAAMMVTNQTRSARDLARTNYFHFLMEYPQAKNRFKKQLEFLLKNLRYEYVEGRQSVMEALNLVLTKVGDNVLQDQLGIMFIPLIHSMANDDSSDCRTMAGALVKKLFERADSQRLKDFTADLRSWLEQDEDSGLKRLSIQCWGLYFEAAEAKPKELGSVLEQLQAIVEECLERRDEEDWELVYYSLLVFSKLCKTFPDVTLSSSKKSFWAAILSCVSYPHAWVKLSAARLVGSFFADLASTNTDSGLDLLPLKGSRNLQLSEEDMIRLTNSFLKNLTTPNVSEELCTQSVRNLAFLARCFAANGAMWNWRKVDDDDIEDEHEEQNTENGDAASSEEEWGGFSPPPGSEKPGKPITTPALHRLITRLSGIIRRETKIMKLPSLFPKSATMTLLETLTAKLPIPALSPSLPHLLTTLSTLTDPATTIPRSTDPSFNDAYRALIDKAREILDALQKRMGTQEYVKAMGEVQRGVKLRREERRQKRKVEAVAAPEKWGREKRRRNEVKKVKRKERSAEYRGKRRGW